MDQSVSVRHGLVGVLLFSLGLAGCDSAAEIGFRSGSPLDSLPEWISPLLESGLRPDWSADGRRLIYLDALVGNVHELEIASGASRPLTAHFEHRGFSRARYLSSGDLLAYELEEESENWREIVISLAKAVRDENKSL